MKNWICRSCWRRSEYDANIQVVMCGCGNPMEIIQNVPINNSKPIGECIKGTREGRVVISVNTAIELTHILDRYIEKYGGQTTISELLYILNTDCLVLN